MFEMGRSLINLKKMMVWEVNLARQLLKEGIPGSVTRMVEQLLVRNEKGGHWENLFLNIIMKLNIFV